MTINKLPFLTFAAAACLGIASLSASAQTIQEDFVKTDLGDNVTISLNGSNLNVFAGQLNFKIAPMSNPLNYGTPFDTYCVDLTHEITTGEVYSGKMTPTSSGLNNGGHIAYLFNKYGQGTNAVQDNDHAAALQIAIWEMTTDNTFDLTSGTFLYNPGGNVQTIAQGYLNEAKTNTASAFWMDASLGGTYNVSTRGQNVLAPTSVGGPIYTAAVPEPGLVALMGCVPALGGAYWLKRRKRK